LVHQDADLVHGSGTVMLSSRGGVGEIRPHGILLAAEEHDLSIVIASANAVDLGIDPTQLIGRGLSAVLASPSERQIRESLAQLASGNPTPAVAVTGARFDAILHRTGGMVVIELEPVREHIGLSCLQRAIDRLQRAHRPTEIVRIGAEEIQALLGFERLALYRNRAGSLELSVAIPDDGNVPEPVSFDEGEQPAFVANRQAPGVPLVGTHALDMRVCVLRNVSIEPRPGAWFAVSLDGWGVVVAEHPVPKLVPYGARAAAHMIARLVAWHLSMGERLLDELRASDMAKDEFLATVSHELRTPLNAMLGWLRLIEAGQVAPERQGQAIATVTRNGAVLAQLVEELLDVSRVVTGKMRIDLQPVIPAGVVDAALAIVQPTAEAKGITITSHVDPSAGPVLADAGRLQQIVWNLVSNAVKFTPEGGVIDVGLRRVGSSIEIVVSDNGAGIDPAELPFVFERFRQGDDATTRAHGLGLGLAIVRHLVELHGGDVSARSAGTGKGATFTVRLPLATGRQATGQIAAVQAPPVFAPAPQLRGLRVLAVDDEKDANELIRAALQSSGVDVVTASSADEVLMLLPRANAHILISDIGMPGVDGYALIQAVRKLPERAGGRIPAIAVTAFARPQDRSRAFLAGFDVYLPKPIDPAELIAVMCNLSGRRDNGTSDRIEAARPEVATLARQLEGTRILVVDDDPDGAEMLAEILRMHGARVDVAHSAAAGMDLIRTLRPDVLVSDISLPDKDGFAFVRELRATGSDEGGWIPAIAVSGHADPETSREAILAGFQLHVPKPIDPPDLIARLSRLVGRTARRT
jgi:CheY-like chemotaxis protein/nitrogen-specific signal transduction histidine kinase